MKTANFEYKNKTQMGRSMIEMLGMLAIVGILSVGGLIGYAKAMEHYRVNETINQIRHIVLNVHNLFYARNSYAELSNSGDYLTVTTNPNRLLADKAKLFPESIVNSGYKNLYDGGIKFYRKGKYTKTDNKAFVITYYNVPKEACIELAVKDWKETQGLVAFKIVGSGDDNYITIHNIFASTATSYTDGVGIFNAQDIPMTPSQAVTICDTETNKIDWIFD